MVKKNSQHGYAAVLKDGGAVLEVFWTGLDASEWRSKRLQHWPKKNHDDFRIEHMEYDLVAQFKEDRKNPI